MEQRTRGKNKNSISPWDEEEYIEDDKRMGIMLTILVQSRGTSAQDLTA